MNALEENRGSWRIFFLSVSSVNPKQWDICRVESTTLSEVGEIVKQMLALPRPWVAGDAGVLFVRPGDLLMAAPIVAG